MFLKSALAIVSMISIQSFSATLNVADLQKSLDTQKTTLDSAQKDANAAGTALQEADRQYRQAKAKWEETAGGSWGGFFQGSGDANLKAAMEKAAATREAALASYQKAANASADANRKWIESAGDLNTARGSLDTLIIKQLGLTGDFSQLTAKIGSDGAAFSALSQKYDNALLGKYMQDKMKAMLNDSGTFCAAKNQCDGKGGPVSDSAMKKLFSQKSSGELNGSSSSASSTKGAKVAK